MLAILELTALVLSGLWFWSQPSYEPLITGILALAALLGTGIRWQSKKKRDKPIPAASTPPPFARTPPSTVSNAQHNKERARSAAVPASPQSVQPPPSSFSNVMGSDGSPPEILKRILSAEQAEQDARRMDETDILSLIESWVYHRQTAFYGKVIEFGWLDNELGIPFGSSKKHLSSILEARGYSTREGNTSVFVIPLQEL